MLEILQLLLEPSTGLETQQAIAPLLVAAAVAAPSIAAAVSSGLAARSYKKLGEETQGELDDLEDPSFGVSSSLQNLALQPYDPTILDRQFNQLNSATGTAMNVLSKGTGGNVADVLRAQNAGALSIGADAANKSFQARTNLGSAEQTAMRDKDQYLVNREATLDQRAFQLENARINARTEMINNIGQSVADGFGGYMAGQNFNAQQGMRQANAAMYGLGQPNLTDEQKMQYQNIIAEQLGLPNFVQSPPPTINANTSSSSNGQMMINPFASFAQPANPLNLNLSPFQTQLPPVSLSQGSGFLGFGNAMIPNSFNNDDGSYYDTYSRNPFIGEHGAIVKSPSVGLLERMHGVKMSPGKFSHKENPIDIVQQGIKIGEMTGGEGIMPPDMMIEIKAHIGNGDADSLLSLMSDILNKWESEADIEQKAKEKKNAD